MIFDHKPMYAIRTIDLFDMDNWFLLILKCIHRLNYIVKYKRKELVPLEDKILYSYKLYKILL